MNARYRRFWYLGVCIVIGVMLIRINTENGSAQHPLDSIEGGRTAQTQATRNDHRHQVQALWLPNNPDASIAKNLLLKIPNASAYNPFRNCSSTCQISLDIPKEAEHEPWRIRTYNAKGQPKLLGGDTFYVSFTFGNEKEQHADLVAHVTDLQDGTYHLEFSTTPMKPKLLLTADSLHNVTISVYLEYTCGIDANYFPPRKKDWKNGAAVRRSYTVSTTISHLPAYQTFQQPGISDKNKKLSRYDHVVSFGDSLMEILVKSKLRNVGYHRPATYWADNIWQPLNLATVDEVLDKLDLWHGAELNGTNMTLLNGKTTNASIALLLGSSAWDVLYDVDTDQPNFENHTDAMKRFLSSILLRYGKQTDPSITLYWRSPSPLHIHRVKKNCFARCIQITKYMGRERAALLYRLQKNLIAQEFHDQVMWLDVYEAYHLSADYTKPGDGVHYEDKLNRKILDWFY